MNKFISPEKDPQSNLPIGLSSRAKAMMGQAKVAQDDENMFEQKQKPCDSDDLF
jgi:hypothetical protein